MSMLFPNSDCITNNLIQLIYNIEHTDNQMRDPKKIIFQWQFCKYIQVGKYVIDMNLS